MVQVQFQLEEDLNPEPERERDPFGNIDEGSRTVPYSPFLYRPFDETTWDLIDDTALDILGGCVENHQLGGQDLAGKHEYAPFPIRIG